MARINIEIPDDIHEALRQKKADTGVPVREIVIRALRECLDEDKQKESSD